jgi:hypothetical protein
MQCFTPVHWDMHPPLLRHDTGCSVRAHRAKHNCWNLWPHKNRSRRRDTCAPTQAQRQAGKAMTQQLAPPAQITASQRIFVLDGGDNTQRSTPHGPAAALAVQQASHSPSEQPVNVNTATHWGENCPHSASLKALSLPTGCAGTSWLQSRGGISANKKKHAHTRSRHQLARPNMLGERPRRPRSGVHPPPGLPGHMPLSVRP